jgi:hypothetical protein
VLIVIVAYVLGGCAVVREELNNRGGYLDYLADRYWMHADSKQLRVLRAYTMQAAVGRLAAVSPWSANDRNIMAVRMAAANAAFADAFRCAYDLDQAADADVNKLLKENIAARKRGCVFFDDRMVEYTRAIFRLAQSALSDADSRSLVARISGGGLDALAALFELGSDAVLLGQSAAALYRDTVELEVVVWIEDERDVLRARTGTLKTLYGNGSGKLAEWKTELKRLKAEAAAIAIVEDRYPFPQTKHFAEIKQVVDRTCDAMTASRDVREICKKEYLAPALLAMAAPETAQ